MIFKIKLLYFDCKLLLVNLRSKVQLYFLTRQLAKEKVLSQYRREIHNVSMNAAKVKTDLSKDVATYSKAYKTPKRKPTITYKEVKEGVKGVWDEFIEVCKALEKL